MTSKSRNIIWKLVVVVLMVGALCYVVHSINWYNYVRTKDGPLRIVEVESDESGRQGPWVDVDGKPTPVAELDVERWSDGKPRIDYGIHELARDARWNSLLIAVFIVGAAPFLGAVRLWMLLGIHDIRIRLWLLVKVTFAGNFFNLVMPGLVMGDAVKAYYLWKHTEKRAEVLMIIVADRVIGLLGLLIVAAVSMVGSLLVGDQPQQPQQQAMLWIAGLLASGTIGGCAFFSGRVRRLLRVDAIIARLPLAGTISRLDGALLAMRSRKRTVALAMGITLIIHVCVLTSTSFVGAGFAMTAPRATYFLIMPLAFVAAAIPIVPQGFGQMEFVLIEYFRPLGSGGTTTQACMLAIGARLTQWLWSLPGCLVPLFGGHLPSTARMREEIEAVRSESDEGRAPPAESEA